LMPIWTTSRATISSSYRSKETLHWPGDSI